MNPLIDPQDLIKQTQPGAALYAAGMLDGTRITALFIREERIHIAAISDPTVEIRAGIFYEKAASPLVLIADINNEKYETWWNYHQDDGRESFELMTTQGKLPILFFSATKMEKSIAIPNRHAEFFKRTIIEINDRPVWSMSDFDKARKVIETRYPTVVKLWRALKSR
jgi:hypothetical protein